jgi:hypothetical protein
MDVGVVTSSSKLPLSSQQILIGVSITLYSRKLFRCASLTTAMNHIAPGFMVADSHKRCGAPDAAFHEYDRLLHRCKDRLQRIECKFPIFQPCVGWNYLELLIDWTIGNIGLRYLVEACNTVGRDSYTYQEKLDKLLSAME